MGSVIRTCVGCRQRVGSNEMVRFYARSGVIASEAPGQRRHESGRGAWVHPDCVSLALSRKAFQRALKIPPSSTVSVQ